MSALDTALADTVGLVWRAASGTVDPWTKANIQQDETSGLNTAKGGDYPQIYGPLTPEEQAVNAAQSGQDVTTVLKQANADPSQFLNGLKNSLSEAFSLSGSIGKTLLFAGIGGLLLLLAFNKLGSK
jgi:hypothetical protein